MGELESIATELYVLAPAEFTAARNARAKAAAGELGARVKALPKPSAAAWATNLLAGARADDLAQLFALGDALREAQDGMDRATLTKLGSQRRALIAALAKQAAALASEAEHPVNSAAIIDIEHTLQAGMTDAGAAAAVTSGRLIRALSGDGLDAVDLENAVAGALPAVRIAPRAPTPSKQAIEKERKALAAAESRVHEAAEAADAAETAAKTAGRRRESLAQEREDLRAELADVESQLAFANKALDEAERARKAAARDLDRAERERDTLGG